MTMFIKQSINRFICPEIQYRHWTAHRERMQPPLTDARKNNVSNNNK